MFFFSFFRNRWRLFKGLFVLLSFCLRGGFVYKKVFLTDFFIPEAKQCLRLKGQCHETFSEESNVSLADVFYVHTELYVNIYCIYIYIYIIIIFIYIHTIKCT